MNSPMRRPSPTVPDVVPIIGDSPAAVLLRRQVSRAAHSLAKVLITGESGTGKEVVARLIHAEGPRASGLFVPVNCAGVPEALLESELFGHAKGSYTGAYRDEPGAFDVAHHGTVLLDEIGETSLRMQTVLLRFLETGELQTVGVHGQPRRVDVRIIAATNRDLTRSVEEGAFREDVFYRLNVINVVVPPLRERPADVAPLARHFLARFAADEHRACPVLSTGALAALSAYAWPGNVRELQNIVERLVVGVDGPVIEAHDLPAEVLSGTGHVRHSGDGHLRSEFDVDVLYGRMAVDRVSFWSVAYPAFMMRDITRETLRTLVRRGLMAVGGNYRALADLFNLAPAEYKRFHNFLSQHECLVPYRDFRPALRARGTRTPTE